jgi:hypothetical protein
MCSPGVEPSVVESVVFQEIAGGNGRLPWFLRQHQMRGIRPIQDKLFNKFNFLLSSDLLW